MMSRCWYPDCGARCHPGIGDERACDPRPGAAGAFDARLRAAGAAIVDAWAPGLTDQEIDARVAPIGVTLPEEARLWWRWHDGLRPGAPSALWDIMPGRSLFALTESLELYVAERDRCETTGFRRSFFSLSAGIQSSCFQCAGARDAAVPVYVIGDWAEPAPRLALPSIGELVRVWMSYIDAGLVTTNSDGSWRADSHLLPQEVLELGVY
jgi:hypothetical protein